MMLQPPGSTLTDTLFPCSTLFRSSVLPGGSDLDPQVGGRLAHHALDLRWSVAGIQRDAAGLRSPKRLDVGNALSRSEEHTSELQSLMRISYAVFCLKKKNITE